MPPPRMRMVRPRTTKMVMSIKQFLRKKEVSVMMRRVVRVMVEGEVL